MAWDDKNLKIWMDGELVDWKDAKIHVLSHVVHYGSAVFEGIRCYNNKKGSAVFCKLHQFPQTNFLYRCLAKIQIHFLLPV